MAKGKTGRALKLFRTTAGFEDAYVAAPSRKAALAAWGTDKDLFARGMAEQVGDPQVCQAALDRPGEVIRVPRGTLEQHLVAAAAQAPEARRKPKRADRDDEKPPPPAPRKRQPPPSRAKLEAARNALEDKEREAARAIAELSGRIERLREERDALRRESDAAIGRLKERLKREGESYRAALDAWDG